MKQVKMICIGAGARGMYAYAPYAKSFPDKLCFVAVADPIAQRREAFAAEYNVPRENIFADWKDALAAGIAADAALIATGDNKHVEPACMAMEQGYDVLMEKPVSKDPVACALVQKTAEKTGKTASVCHVLRYTVFFSKLREMIASGAIGDLTQIVLNENIGFWHFAHSYVRGNWRREDETSPSILAKSCHDMDILLYLVGKNPVQVSSFGSLKHFKAKNAPKGAAARCLDCSVAEDCPYSAMKVYMKMENTAWPVSVMTSDFSEEGRIKALREGPYGRCVYACDNDVVDHQSTIIEFEDEITACFTMSAFTDYGSSRTIRIMGTLGEIRGELSGSQIELTNFKNEEKTLIDVSGMVNNEYSHGGGDFGLIEGFVQMEQDGTPMRTSIQNSIQSHLMCMAAEKSRHEKIVVDMKEYTKQCLSEAE